MIAFSPPLVLATTGSTQDRAREAAEAGAVEGTVVQALAQTAGRGRRGRVWESPPGNLYLSVVLRPPEGSRAASDHLFAAALAVHATVGEALPEAPPDSVRLKWPNDVLARGRKVAGLLGEVVAAPSGSSAPPALILGVGLNRAFAPARALFPATFLLAEAGEGRDVPSLDALRATLLRHLAAWISRLRSEGFAPLRAAWNARALQGVLTVHDATGATVTGESEGLDDTGRLLLRDAQGCLRRLASGDVASPIGVTEAGECAQARR